MLKDKAVLIINKKLLQGEIGNAFPYEISKQEEAAIITKFWKTYSKNDLYTHLMKMVEGMLFDLDIDVLIDNMRQSPEDC